MQVSSQQSCSIVAAQYYWSDCAFLLGDSQAECTYEVFFIGARRPFDDSIIDYLIIFNQVADDQKVG